MLTSKCILYTKKKTLPQLPLLLLSLAERSPVLQALLLSLLLDGIRLRGEHIHAVPRLVGLAPLDVDPAPVLTQEFGPLKADHSIFCPEHFTHAEREEKCVSVQENVWGTDGLAKL